MKKVLLASAAVLAFGTVAQAAEPVKLTIGGYAVENVGYASNKDALNKSDVDVQSDVVLTFAGKTTLDNGITVGVNVDTFGSQRQDSRNVNATCGKGAGLAGLAGSTNCSGNSNVKRSYVTVGTAFGTAIVGEREDVGYIVHNSAPDVGPMGLQDGSWYQWVVSPSKHRAYTATNASRYDDRGNKFTYVTPAFYGLAAGFTYAPSISASTQGHTSMATSSDTALYAPAGYVNGADFGGDLYVGGLAYANTFGDVSVKADAGVGQANIANLRVYQAGTQISYAGFTFGGSYFQRDVPNDAHVFVSGTSTLLSNGVTQTAAYAGQSWDVGLSYKTGPFAVSLGYFQDRSKDYVNGIGADTTRVVSLAGAYTAGPGVTFRAGIDSVQYIDGASQDDSANKNGGVAVVTGVKVDF